MLETFNKILVVAAHPDDEVLGVGGTIKKMTNISKKVDIIIVTDGSSTQYKGDEQILERKFEEAEKAAEILGARFLDPLNFPDMKLDTVSHVDKNQALEKLIKQNKYDTVFVQNRSDINKDHQEVFYSTMVAVRPHPFQHVHNVYQYYVNSSTEWGMQIYEDHFSPNVFIDIEETIQVKLEAMKVYKSELREFPHPRSLESIEISARYFGSSIGINYAEPFQLIWQRC